MIAFIDMWGEEGRGREAVIAPAPALRWHKINPYSYPGRTYEIREDILFSPGYESRRMNEYEAAGTARRLQ